MPIALPIGAGEDFRGIIDLTNMKAIQYNESSQGAEFEFIDIPDELKADADKWRNFLVEEVASFDDTLMEKYLEGEEISPDEIKDASLISSGDISSPSKYFSINVSSKLATSSTKKFLHLSASAFNSSGISMNSNSAP